MLALERSGKQRRAKGAALALRFLGSNRNVAIGGERPGAGRVNYLLGNDPAKWHTGLRTYERVVYRNLWPGMDMVFRGTEGQAEVRVPRPPRSPRRRHQARLPRREAALARPAGKPAHRHLARRPHRHAAGELPARRRQARARRAAASRSAGAARYGFALGRGYDRRYPLVIDPGLVYSTYLGGSGADVGHGIAVDGAGSAYVTGIHDLDGLPDDRGRLRRRPTTATTTPS